MPYHSLDPDTLQVAEIFPVEDKVSLSHAVNTMVTDCLALQRAKASAAKI